MQAAAAGSRQATRSKAPRHRFALSLLGGFTLTCDDEPVVLTSRKAQALLAYLTLSPTAAEPRERLHGLLWSESSEEKARGSLRQTLHGLRDLFRSLGFDGLQVGREDVSLARPALEVDVRSVIDQVSQGVVHPLLAERTRLAETLLTNFEDIDPSFRVWLLIQRQSLHQQLQQRLEQALGAAEGERVRPLAQALVNLDPTHEEACRRLMRDHAERGDIAGALRVYKRLWDLLDEDYGTEPSEPTQALIVRIKNNEIGSPASAADPAPVDRQPAETAPAIAERSSDPLDLGRTFLIISEFDGSGVGPDLQYLVQGLRHELIARLVRFRDWSVLDGRGLGVNLIRTATAGARRFSLDASVRRAGEGFSVTLTIKEQPNERYVWSEVFALDLQSFHDLHQSFVRRIATALNIHISTERLIATARRPGIPLSAQERWLQGEQYVLALRADDWSRAAGLFQSIIDEAPQFSPAYSGLVQIMNGEHLAFPGRRRLPETSKRALALARTAVQTDPFDSRAQLCLAWAFALDGQFYQAEANFNLALNLNESDPWTLTSSALGVAFCGLHDRAVALANQALELNLEPSRSHWGYQTTLRFVCGDYAGCIEAAGRAQEAITNLPGWHAAALAHLGETAKAAAAGRRLIEVIRDHWHGTEAPTDEAISSWFLGAFPIRLKADWERLRDGLLLAGVPIASELRA